ncbi:MAG: ferredoxin family protein [Armatimonadota bacterium]
MPWLAGVPREEIEWHPTINQDECVRCGMCMNCGKNVYEWTDDGPVVARPDDCVVGCSTCANLCRGRCITFPDPDELYEVYQEHGVWTAVKEKLREEGAIPD